jgi:hypothetical protein
LRLARGSLDPFVGFDRIPPEVFLGRRLALAHEILLNDLESGRNGQPLIAVWPVAAVEHAVESENVQHFVQPGAVEGEVHGDFVVHLAPAARRHGPFAATEARS